MLYEILSLWQALISIQDNIANEEASKTVTLPKDKKAVKDKLTFKSKGKKKADPPAEDKPSEIDPQDAGCEVTDSDKQSTVLMATYKGCPPLK